jgi:hypothetical protein
MAFHPIFNYRIAENKKAEDKYSGFLGDVVLKVILIR